MWNDCFVTHLFLLLAFGTALAPGILSQQLGFNPCYGKTKCSECITTNPLCAWCKAENFTNDATLRSRCDYFTVLEDLHCNYGSFQGNIVYPSSQWTATEVKPLSKPGDPLESIVQLYPQEIHLKLRPRNPLKLEVKYRQFKSSPSRFGVMSEVEMRDNAMYNIEVTYHSSCLGTKVEETNVCRDLQMGDTITFEVQMEATSCPSDPKDLKQQFHIYPVGVPDSLEINLELLCECGCEKPGQVQHNSARCSLRGTYECGICNCELNYYGRFCECSMATSVIDVEDFGCMPPNETNMICSGRGQCSCGRCQCYPRADPNEHVYGSFCECDNFSCDRHNGQLCSGPSHGVCGCFGTCVCLNGFTGYACQCPSSNEACIGSNGEICSGNGVCDCGLCRCKDKYMGSHCDNCPLGTCNGDDDKNDPEAYVQETKGFPFPVNILDIIMALVRGIRATA